MKNRELIYQAVVDSLIKFRPYFEQKEMIGQKGHIDKKYEDMMDLLESAYSFSPNREEFLNGITRMLTIEQAEIFPAFPLFSFDPEDHPAQPLSWVAERVRPELEKKLDVLTKDMVEKHFILFMGERNGEKVYMRNYLFGLVRIYAFLPDTPLTEPSLHWFYNAAKEKGVSEAMKPEPIPYETLPHEGILTGDHKFGKIPMNMVIPDEREIIPYDLASEVIKKSRRMAVKPCLCRLAMEKKNKKQCGHPVEGYCMGFDEAADAVIASGLGKEKTKEEMLEILKECRDRGLVQQVSNANRPLVICNCCKDCCILLNSLARGERSLSKPSRFVAKIEKECRKCQVCIENCPMDALVMTVTGALVLTDKCIGCGLCAAKCPFGVISLKRKDGEIKKERDRKVVDRVYI